MIGYNDFMRLAHGRDHELERRLRESSEPRVAKIYRLIFKEPITESDVLLADSLASVLGTTADDDYVVTIVMNNRARVINAELCQTYYRECKFLDWKLAGVTTICLTMFIFIAHNVAEIKDTGLRTLSVINATVNNRNP